MVEKEDDGQKEFEIALAKAIDDADKDVVKSVYYSDYTVDPVDEKGVPMLTIHLLPAEIQILIVSLYMLKTDSDVEKKVFDQVLSVYKEYRHSEVNDVETHELVISFLELEIIMLSLYEFRCKTGMEIGLLESLDVLHKKCKSK